MRLKAEHTGISNMLLCCWMDYNIQYLALVNSIWISAQLTQITGCASLFSIDRGRAHWTRRSSARKKIFFITIKSTLLINSFGFCLCMNLCVCVIVCACVGAFLLLPCIWRLIMCMFVVRSMVLLLYVFVCASVGFLEREATLYSNKLS